jgi:hypothetical protein
VSRYFTVKADTNEELQAFLQAVEWINDSSVVILDENLKRIEALIHDADSEGVDETIWVNG